MVKLSRKKNESTLLLKKNIPKDEHIILLSNYLLKFDNNIVLECDVDDARLAMIYYINIW
jgi:hypothetical protein